MTETFQDGSTIETDEITGNRTVVGSIAHAEYIRRLQAERITKTSSPAVISYCTNLDGTLKAQLIRKGSFAGGYSWEVWSDANPTNSEQFIDEELARKTFRSAMAHGTNGFGKI